MVLFWEYDLGIVHCRLARFPWDASLRCAPPSAEQHSVTQILRRFYPADIILVSCSPPQALLQHA